MNRSIVLIAAALAVATSAFAQTPMRSLADPVVANPNPESLFASKDTKLNVNKQSALHIMRELLQCNQWDRAGEWLSAKYIQHNPMAASGLDGVKKYFIEVAKRKPTPTCTKLTSPVGSPSRPKATTSPCSPCARSSTPTIRPGRTRRRGSTPGASSMARPTSTGIRRRCRRHPRSKARPARPAGGFPARCSLRSPRRTRARRRP